MIKNETPRKTATPVIIWIKWAISLAMGVSPVDNPDAKLAIRPITERSPVRITTPLAVPIFYLNNLNKIKNQIQPSTANVLKKAKFFVSNGFSCVISFDRDWGSDSPVNEELSTLNPCASNILISATRIEEKKISKSNKELIDSYPVLDHQI